MRVGLDTVGRRRGSVLLQGWMDTCDGSAGHYHSQRPILPGSPSVGGSPGPQAGKDPPVSAQTEDRGGLTFEEFLRFEAAYAGDERFELQGGTVVMMSGGGERHDLMVMALSG
jgi:hypothetical protein